ncbi:MAG: helix-turn-helix domain-containing protein [Kiritimatiellae bacterium]|nr:helix-turn-helix domain-containing protein [Kiritimatiellia bacterium]
MNGTKQQPDGAGLFGDDAPPAPARPADPWMEGFAEGRRSMARSIALKLRGTMPDEDLASLVGLDAAALEALLAPPEPRPEAPAGAAPAAPAFIRGLALVEPNFVRVVRVSRGLTQAQLARRLGVNERTVCEWETASGPVRVKTSSYKRLASLAAR